MSSQVSPLRPRLTKTTRSWIAAWNRLGEQTAFYTKTLSHIGQAVGNYKEETLRLIAQMSLGVGALALIGGSVVIVSFIVLNVGSLAGIVGFSQLSRIGVEALSGFFSAYINPRISCPLVTAIGLTATIGAGATAQIGAMRINEEIDALEVLGIRTISYLASTRVLAGVIVVIPLFCLSEAAAFLAARFVVVVADGQSSGGYDHYFNTFLRPTDLIWALLQVILQGFTIMLIHTYYGFNAFGGPAGVGEATGRAVRTSMVAAVFITTVSALALYGRSGDFHLSG
jgi:phospholipid/cholesterol/gamma-HCH transport system permease protein